MENTFMCGDAIQVLKRIPDGVVQSCVTSPPYFGAVRDYGVSVTWDDGWFGELGHEPSDELYITHLVDIFTEVHRVLRDDGTLWLNLGDKFENKDLLLIPHRTAIALKHQGWIVRQDNVWAKENVSDSVTDRTTRSHEFVFHLAKSKDYFYNADAIREPLAPSSIKRIQQPNFAKQKGGAKDYGHGTNANRSARKMLENFAKDPKPRNARSVWNIPTEPFLGDHFAVMPLAVAERCVLVSTRPGDLVLDLFGGRGTTSLAAKANGRTFCYIDAKQENLKIAQTYIGRGGQWQRSSTLDAESALTLWGEMR